MSCVQVKALWQADRLSKESYQMSNSVVPNAVPPGTMAPTKGFLGARIATERGYTE